MNPIKLIRKLGKILRGGATFRDMFLGVFLGFAIGMTPGVNLTVIILIFLLLFLNANGALGGLSILLGKVLCLVLAPLTFNLGYWMIHSLGLVGLVRWAANTSVVALLDLHVYSLIGALPLIIIIGGALAWFVPKSIAKMRATLGTATAGSKKVRKVAENKFTKIIARIAFGKQKDTFVDMADKKSPLIRKSRVIVALVLVAVLFAGQLLFLDTLVKSGLESSIGSANGAEVNIASVDLSLGSGRLVIEGLQVTDAARPTHNKVQAERIVAQIDVGDMLARRFVVDLIECNALRTDTERKKTGDVYRQPKETEEKPSDSMLKKLGGKSAEYYAEVKKFNERLQKLQEFLKSDDPGATQTDTPDKNALARKAKAMGYLKLSAKEYLSKHPTWVIRQITVNQIELRPSLPTFTAEGKNLSSHPSLYPEKMELKALPDKNALKTFLTKKPASGEKKSGGLGGLLGGKKDDKKDTPEKEDDKKKDQGGGVLDNLLKK